jgi:hypothetical protein
MTTYMIVSTVSSQATEGASNNERKMFLLSQSMDNPGNPFAELAGEVLAESTIIRDMQRSHVPNVLVELNVREGIYRFCNVLYACYSHSLCCGREVAGTEICCLG